MYIASCPGSSTIGSVVDYHVTLLVKVVVHLRLRGNMDLSHETAVIRQARTLD